MAIEEKVCVKQWSELKVITKRHRNSQVSLLLKFDNTGCPNRNLGRTI